MSSKHEGFFKNFHETINQSVDDLVLNNFANLEQDSKRVGYICGLPALKNYDLTPELEKNKNGRGAFPVRKDAEKARRLKADGNAAVPRGDWGEALRLYSESLIAMPGNETEEISIILANRSAALYHLTLMEASLADIQRCLDLGYPKNLRYKVLERRARCLLALKRHEEALKAFKETITALDEGKIAPEKKQKMQTDAQLMLAIINKGQQLAGKNTAVAEPSRNSPPLQKLTGKANKRYPAASEAIDFVFEESRGRYATASRDIEAGEVLLVERAYSSVLLAEFARTHCQHCFRKCSIPSACPKCPNVIYCSDKCLQESSIYHAYECPILPLLWKSGCSITCLMALRIITQNDIQYFRNITLQLEEKPSGPYKSNDYRNIYNLVAHEDKRTKKDFLHRTQMAAFLVKMLELSGYFNGKPRDTEIKPEELKTMAPDDKFKPDVELLGGLILRNLQTLQFNAHEVFELQCPKPEVGKNVIKHEGKSVFVAGAVFSTLALFNHSCDPGVVRYYNGPSIVVRAVKNIRKGEEVAENYGPIFTTVPKADRQATLKEQYWFDCGCAPCQQNWPLYSDMNENYMRFKCDSDQPCSNVVPVALDCREFMVQCGVCQQYTNILKGLKSLQDTDMLLRLAKNSMESGKYGEALKKFIEVLKLYDATLAPPYRSFYDCVQNIRRCMLAVGNYSILA